MGVDSPLWRLDWLLALAVAGLIGLGLAARVVGDPQRMLDADLDPTPSSSGT
jgi:hypothetical protein